MDSMLRMLVQVGDHVMWSVGRGHSTATRFGIVQAIEGKKLRCFMLTEGRNTIEARRVVHYGKPDLSFLLGQYMLCRELSDGRWYFTPYNNDSHTCRIVRIEDELEVYVHTPYGEKLLSSTAYELLGSKNVLP